MTADLAGALVKPVSGELTWRNYANLAAYVLNAAVTYGSMSGIFGATNTVQSEKYQTLVTPAGFAFAIWGPIFLGELIFAACQMLPRYRSTKVVELVTPGWVAACTFQVLWTLFFAQDWIASAFVCMVGILVGLVVVALCTDGLAMTWEEYWVLRWSFSLHMGWIIAATCVNLSVLADFSMAQPAALLGLTVTLYGAVCIIATFFSMVMKSADPIVCFVAAWAFNAIKAELSDPSKLDNPGRHNPHTWDRVTLEGLEIAAGNISMLALALAAVAIARVLWTALRGSDSTQKNAEHSQELVDGVA